MKKAKRDPLDAAELRRLAEERPREHETPALPRSDFDVRRLVQELETHRVELEIQNEELRAARVEVEAGLERYTELFDFAPIGYAILAVDGAIREINHAGALMFDKPRAHFAGANFRTLITMASRTAFGAMIGRALAAPSRESCEVEHLRAGSKPLHLALTARVLPRSDPVVLLAFEDITEQREKAAKLERTERTLRDADRRKDEFLAVLSHELRNPLAPVRNSLYVLEHAEPGGEQARKAVTIIDRQITLLTRLTDDLLDVTRITRGKVQIQRETVEIGDLVRRTLDDHRASFEASRIRLEGRVGGGPLWVDADPARLQQCLSNVLGNAEKFTPRGGVVVVSAQRERQTAVVRVRDSGRGIDGNALHHPDGLMHLFEPFVQLPQSLARVGDGLGLGLAMVKGLVEMHGGSVAIASDGIGRGTELTIVLPLIESPVIDRAVAVPVARRPRRVLVIEDNVDSADSLRDALVLGGHEVRVAHDGTTGVEVAREFRPEIAICDIGLPGLDGYAVARAIRADWYLRRTYLIALTGYAQPGDQQRATEAGFDQRIAKPADLHELDRLLSELPGRHE